MYILVLPVSGREELYYSGTVNDQPAFSKSQEDAKRFPSYPAVYDAYWDLRYFQNVNVAIGIPTV